MKKDKKQVGFLIPVEVIKKVNKKAEKEGVSRTEIYLKLITLGLEKE